MRKRSLIVFLIAITATGWGQRSNAPEYHKKDDDYLFRFGYYLGLNQVNFKIQKDRLQLTSQLWGLGEITLKLKFLNF